jgi:hypothetical protein
MRIFFASVLAALTTACASLPMPLAEGAPKMDSSKPLYLMSVRVNNEYKPRWKPDVLSVLLDAREGGAKPERLAFRMDDKGRVSSFSEGGSVTYLLRFTADNPAYTLRGLNAMSSAFPFLGTYFVPLHADLPSATAGAHYLGAVNAVIRERRDNEFRAGPVVPLIDQAVAGASTGTFDIEITDAYERDVALFKKTFTALDGVEIQKALLPPWSRSEAQMYWERN